jgi:hypothetical protein
MKSPLTPGHGLIFQISGRNIRTMSISEAKVQKGNSENSEAETDTGEPIDENRHYLKDLYADKSIGEYRKTPIYPPRRFTNILKGTIRMV